MHIHWHIRAIRVQIMLIVCVTQAPQEMIVIFNPCRELSAIYAPHRAYRAYEMCISGMDPRGPCIYNKTTEGRTMRRRLTTMALLRLAMVALLLGSCGQSGEPASLPPEPVGNCEEQLVPQTVRAASDAALRVAVERALAGEQTPLDLSPDALAGFDPLRLVVEMLPTSGFAPAVRAVACGLTVELVVELIVSQDGGPAPVYGKARLRMSPAGNTDDPVDVQLIPL
jgi:hypothetical protein